MDITTEGQEIKVKEIKRDNFNLATSKASIAMSQSLGGTDTKTAYGLRSTSPDGTHTTHFVAAEDKAPKYIQKEIKAHEEEKA